MLSLVSLNHGFISVSLPHHNTLRLTTWVLSSLYSETNTVKPGNSKKGWEIKQDATGRGSHKHYQGVRLVSQHNLHRPCQSRVLSHVVLAHAHTPATQVQQSHALRSSTERNSTIPNFADRVPSPPSTGHTKLPRAPNTTSQSLQFPDWPTITTRHPQ